MADFYYIFIAVPGLGSDSPEIEKKLDLAKDWFRFSDKCWVVYTTSDAAKWYKRLSKVVKSRDGRLLIFKLDPSDRQGWITEAFWEWMREVT